MPFDRPTLTQLIDRIAGDIESRLPGTDARLRRQVLTAIARAQAGAAHGQHGHLDWAARQIMPDTAESESLDRHAAIWGLARKAAAAAVGEVIFTGTTGTVIPTGTLLQRADGAEIATTADGTLVAGTITVAALASVAGADGNTADGSALTLVTPLAGVDSQATGGLTGGSDLETDDDLRARLLTTIQSPAHGGRAEDYEMWTLEVAGITRVWVFPLHLGSGTVGIYIVSDDQADSIIPDAAKVSEVQAYIDERRPVTAQVSVFAPVLTPLDLTITLVPNTTATQAAVTAELEDLLRREAQPGGTILLSHLGEAISIAAGETDHALLVPTADVVFNPSELADLGTITWA